MHLLTTIGLLFTSLAAVGADDRALALTSVPGDSRRGQAVFEDVDRGHCLLCHQLSSSASQFQGNIGPALDDVGERLSAEQLRYRLIDSSRLNPETRMPAYYRTKGLVQVASEHKGKPVLSAQEIEDLVAYLRNTQGSK